MAVRQEQIHLQKHFFFNLSRNDQLSLAFLIAVCLAITGFTTYRIYQSELHTYRQKMEKQASLYEAQFKQAFNNHLERLDGLRNFYLTSSYVDRYDFQIYTRTLLNNHTDIESISWAPRISNIERAIHEQQTRDDGFSQYMIYQRDKYGNRIVADPHSEYFPAAYIEPMQKNDIRLGFNYASNAEYLQAMSRARDSGLPVASKFYPGENETHQYLFTVFTPVYNSIAPLNTIELRRQRFRGFIVAEFPLNQIFTLAVPQQKESNFDISVSDITPAIIIDNNGYKQSPPQNSPKIYLWHSFDNSAPALFSYTSQLDFAGRTWQLQFDDYSTNLSERPGIQSAIFFTAGTLFTLLIAAYVIGSSHRRILIENLVEKRTAELKTTKDELEQILSNTVEGIYGVDIRGRTIFANQAALEMTGFTEEEMINNPQHALIHHHYPDGSTYPPEECKIYQAYTKGITTSSDKEVFWHKNGYSIPVEYTSTPIYDEQNNITGAVIIFRNITERKKYEAEIIEARHRAEEASRSKSEFLATMSHEIRTPMNGLLGMAQLLSGTKLDQTQQEYVDAMLQSGEVLLLQINDVLDFSRIESGRLQLEPHAFDLYTLCIQLIQLMSNRAESKGILLQLDYPDNTPRHFIGDSMRIRQIMLNLVNNAIKFTEEGHINISVKCLSRQIDSAKLSIEIKDTGIGIPADQFEHIFNPFTQADASTTRRYGGSGLGLAICKRLADLMHAQIGVNSTVNKGSNFWLHVELPLSESTELFNSFIAPEEKLIFSGNALLVEDNYVNAIVAKNMLSNLGLTITLAENGKIAIEKYKQGNFDLIFMDCQMPVMDGYSATEIIRKYDKNIPVLAITANILPEDINRCIQSGMNACLHKPIEQNRLQHELKHWLPFKQDHTSSAEITTSTDVLQALSLDTAHLERLKNMMDNLFMELIPAYIEGSDKILDELPELIRTGDTSTLERHAHSLKSSSRNVGANSLATLAEKMEKMAHSQNLKAYEDTYPQLQEDYQQIREQLLRYQANINNIK